MEQTALIFIMITNAFLVIILGVLAFLVYKLFQQRLSNKSSEDLQDNQASFHPEILKRMKELETVKSKRSHLFCPNHPDEPGEVSCAICDKIFCKTCIKPFKSLHFCKEHLPFVMRYEWDEVLTIKTSTSDPEEGVRLYEAKQALLVNNDLPSYIETHYKINVDQDYIETYLVLFAIREKVTEVRERLANLIAK